VIIDDEGVDAMSWARTSEWWRALREVSAELELRQDGRLPWQPRYAEIFGDRDGLRRALRYRWTLIEQAQGSDPAWSLGERLLHDAALAEKHTGLLLAIAEQPVPPAAAVA
jgi:hypothetical protein